MQLENRQANGNYAGCRIWLRLASEALSDNDQACERGRIPGISHYYRVQARCQQCSWLHTYRITITSAVVDLYLEVLT